MCALNSLLLVWVLWCCLALLSSGTVGVSTLWIRPHTLALWWCRDPRAATQTRSISLLNPSIPVVPCNYLWERKIRAGELTAPLHGPLLILQQLSPDGHVCKALWVFLFFIYFCYSSSVLLFEDSWGVWCRHQQSRWLRLCHRLKESLARRRSDHWHIVVNCNVSVRTSVRHCRDSLFVSLLCFLHCSLLISAMCFLVRLVNGWLLWLDLLG